MWGGKQWEAKQIGRYAVIVSIGQANALRSLTETEYLKTISKVLRVTAQIRWAISAIAEGRMITNASIFLSGRNCCKCLYAEGGISVSYSKFTDIKERIRKWKRRLQKLPYGAGLRLRHFWAAALRCIRALIKWPTRIFLHTKCKRIRRRGCV